MSHTEEHQRIAYGYLRSIKDLEGRARVEAIDGFQAECDSRDGVFQALVGQRIGLEESLEIQAERLRGTIRKHEALLEGLKDLLEDELGGEDEHDQHSWYTACELMGWPI